MLDRLRAHMDRGEWLTVKRLVSGVLVSEDIAASEKAQAALYGARATMFLKEAFLAASFAQKALSFAQEIMDDSLEGQALFQLAAAKVAIGDNAEARIYLRQFIEGLADRWPEQEEPLGARAYANLGMVLRNQRLYPDSLQAYWQAIVRFERSGETRGQILCHQQAAWVLMLSGELDEAESHLELANGLGPLPPECVTHQLTHEALLALSRDDLTTAVARAEEVLQPDRPYVTTASKAVACYVMGEAARRTGQIDIARRFAYLAREAALEDGLASLLNMVNRLLRQVEVVRGPTSEDG